MPEGDTVHRTARRLDDALTGSVLTLADLRVPRLATTDLSSGLVLGTVSRGKHLLTRIRHDTGSWTLHTHLKMEGSWQVYRTGERWRRPGHQARAVLATDHIGSDWDESEAVRRLLADPARPVREALLDQRNLAGLGTMYAAELCFVCGTAPSRPIGEVPDPVRLVRTARAMLAQNAQRAVQATTGDLRPGERLWVHRRDRRPCRRCGEPIQVASLGQPGRERAAYWCPRCQPA